MNAPATSPIGNRRDAGASERVPEFELLDDCEAVERRCPRDIDVGTLTRAKRLQRVASEDSVRVR